MLTRQVKNIQVQSSVHSEAAKHNTKKEKFGRQKQPHTEFGSFIRCLGIHMMNIRWVAWANVMRTMSGHISFF
jgi:hypothetical protein